MLPKTHRPARTHLLLAGLLSAFLWAGTVQAGEQECSPDPPCPAENGTPIPIEIRTPLGKIPIDLWPDVAPQNVANLLAYIDRGDYATTIVHRSVKDEGFNVIQGGIWQTDGTFIETDDPVCAEDCRPSLRGTVSMARTQDPHSATSQWFINLTDNTFLDPPMTDPGFSVIGEVTGNGMDVADAINALPTTYGEAGYPSVFFKAVGIDGVGTGSTTRRLPHNPEPIGCFDPDNDLAVLFDSELGFAPTDEFGRLMLYSPSCDIDPPPAPECTSPPGCDPEMPGCVEEPDIEIVRGTFINFVLNCQLGGTQPPCILPDSQNPFPFAMSCNGAVASELAREAFVGPQTLITADIVRLPEPGNSALAAGLLALWGLRSRRRL